MLLYEGLNEYTDVNNTDIIQDQVGLILSHISVVFIIKRQRDTALFKHMCDLYLSLKSA